MARNQTPVERMARARGIEKKPRQRPFTWVFERKVTKQKIRDGAPVDVTMVVEKEEAITRTVQVMEEVHHPDGTVTSEPAFDIIPASEGMKRDENGKIEFTTTEEWILNRQTGEKEKVTRKEPKLYLIPAEKRPRMREVPIMEDVEDTWEADLEAAGIKEGPQGCAYRHVDGHEYAVLFEGAVMASKFCAATEESLIDLINEHLAGYPGARKLREESRAKPPPERKPLDFKVEPDFDELPDLKIPEAFEDLAEPDELPADLKQRLLARFISLAHSYADDSGMLPKLEKNEKIELFDLFERNFKANEWLGKLSLSAKD